MAKDSKWWRSTLKDKSDAQLHVYLEFARAMEDTSDRPFPAGVYRRMRIAVEHELKRRAKR